MGQPETPAARALPARGPAVELVNSLLVAARRGDLARVRELYAENAVAISPVFGEVRGAQAIAETWQRLFDTFSDFETEISHVLVDGDQVAVLSSVAATDRVGWFGAPPTHAPIRYKLVLLFAIAGGKIVRDERIYDSAGVHERLQKARLDKELRTAAEVQRILLSRTAHTGGAWQSVGDSLPCRAIGGDFFEILDRPGGDVAVVMGDIAGKGPAAALLAAMLQGMLWTEQHQQEDPAATLARLNRGLLARAVEAKFATLVYALMSPDGRVTYANGGHNPPVLLTRSAVHRLTVGGPLLGGFPDASFEQATIRLDPGDTLVMFTDGVTEARNAAGEEFGESALLECLDAQRGDAPRDLLRQVLAAVKEFCGTSEQSDDITVTVTRRVGAIAASNK